MLKPDKFKIFRLIYSIKDLIAEIRDPIERDDCKMCFIFNAGNNFSRYSCFNSDRIGFINRYGNIYDRNNLCYYCNNNVDKKYADNKYVGKKTR